MNREITVCGRQMHACLLGAGDTTFVLLSGSRVPLPQLEYRPLIKALAREGLVVLLEKFGYGGSDSTDVPRTLQQVVGEYRAALAALDVPLPVVLTAHSAGFLEALYWAQHYPEEVAALVGIDPATPDSYRGFDAEKAVRQLRTLSQKPFLQKIAADRYCRQLFRRLDIPAQRREALRERAARNFSGPVWLAEAQALPENLRTLQGYPLPRAIPTLFFLSNGRGTSMPAALWRQRGLDFLGNMVYGAHVLLDLPHDLYRTAPDQIAEKTAAWLHPAAAQDQGGRL